MMHLFEKRVQFFLVGLFLLPGCNIPRPPAPAALPASPVCVLQNPDTYRLLEYLQVLADTVPGYSMEDMALPGMQERFVPFPDKPFQPQSHRVYWGKVQLENRLPNAQEHSEWVLNFSSTFTRVTLFRPGENGAWDAAFGGTFVPFDKRSFVPSKNGTWFKVLLPPGKVVTLYFRGESERSAMPPTFHAFVQPIDVFYDRIVSAKRWSTLFTGFLLMMLVYNLLNYFFIRDRSYIYYTAYLLMVLVYTAFSSEDLEDWLGGLVFTESPAYFNLFKIALYLGLMSYLAFIRSFLELKRLLPKWDRYFRYVIWLGVPFIALFFFLAFRYQFSYVVDDPPILFYIGLVSLSSVSFVYPLYKTKDPKGFFITAGIAVVSLGFLLTLYSRMTETPFTVFYLKLGTILEILIFSMGLAYRQRQQEKSKQQADFALKESQLYQEKKQVEADRLQELNEFKSRFFTNITHEFRTPLTVLLGMSEQLAKEEKDESKRNKLGLIQRNGEDLLRLVNQILDLAKLESNSLKINYIQGDVLTFLKYVSESMHSLANAQNVLLRVESNRLNIVLDYDPERLLQIVHNLLSNAIKFTPSGGKVLLRADLKDQWLHISVSDSGAGIPADELPRLFERFFQAQNQEYAKAGGTGVGLSLTRELVRAMGGEITVESAVGVGSTFFVKLPVTNNGAFEEKGIAIPKTASSLLPALPLSGTNDADRPTLLLIEDNPDVVEYLNACLKEQYHLEFAYNGQAGIENALENTPDLVVSDVMMPIKDGFEVLDALKNDERTSHIPIILLTAKADVQSRLAGLRKGADAYLSKPFHQEELLVTVENLLETRRKLQLKYRQQVFAPDAAALPAVETELEDLFLQKVRGIIDAHFHDEDFGLPQLCQKIGMSRSQLFRKMKALTDIAPSDLIRQHRLHKAKALLESGAANVTEASWQTGFKDPSYFSKLYQEEFGEAPSATRK